MLLNSEHAVCGVLLLPPLPQDPSAAAGPCRCGCRLPLFRLLQHLLVADAAHLQQQQARVDNHAGRQGRQAEGEPGVRVSQPQRLPWRPSKCRIPARAPSPACPAQSPLDALPRCPPCCAAATRRCSLGGSSGGRGEGCARCPQAHIQPCTAGTSAAHSRRSSRLSKHECAWQHPSCAALQIPDGELPPSQPEADTATSPARPSTRGPSWFPGNNNNNCTHKAAGNRAPKPSPLLACRWGTAPLSPQWCQPPHSTPAAAAPPRLPRQSPGSQCPQPLPAPSAAQRGAGAGGSSR